MFFLSLTLRNARKLGKFGKNLLVVRGTVPQNLGWERGRPMHPSPNILHPSPNVTEKKFKRKITKKVVRNSENVDIFGGPRTETKFVKWSATRKRLRTADITLLVPRCSRTFPLSINVTWLSSMCELRHCLHSESARPKPGKRRRVALI